MSGQELVSKRWRGYRTVRRPTYGYYRPYSRWVNPYAYPYYTGCFGRFCPGVYRSYCTWC